MRGRNPPDALAHLEELHVLKRRRKETGIFLDFDGTLSPIVALPGEVDMPAEARSHLERLPALYGAVVVISGRSTAALWQIIGLPSITYVGNHGLEFFENGEKRVLLPGEVVTQMRAMEPLLRESINCPGTLLELKEYSHAIHYRTVQDKRAARDCILREIEKLGLRGVRITEGKMLVQIRPDHPLDKGKALELIVQEKGLEQVLYAGDDTTDLDAFRSITELVGSGRVLGFKVGVVHPDAPPSIVEDADYVVNGVEGVAQLLGWLSDASE